MADSEDIMYLKELVTGSHEAFDKLYLKYSPLVEMFAVSMLKRESDAADLSQSIFLKIWEKRQSLSDVKSFKSYLYKVTRNAVLDHLAKRHEEVLGTFPDTVLKDLEVSEIEGDVISRDLLMLVEVAVNAMSQRRKTIFYMSRKDGLSHKEIAESLGVSVKTVEYHIGKALSALRRLVKIIILFI